MEKISRGTLEHLKAIECIEKVHRTARTIDIADYLGISMPAVSIMLSKLESKGMIARRKWAPSFLTDKGKEAIKQAEAEITKRKGAYMSFA